MKRLTIILAVLLVFSLINILTIFAHEKSLSVKEMKPMTGETHHLEVKPETKEGYRVPYMEVTATIIEQDTKKENTVELHPMFGGNFHYGINVALKPKQYTLRFHLDTPTFARGNEREEQWLQPVDAEFLFDASKQFEKSVKIGSKETKDMKISFEAEHAESMFILEGDEKERTDMGHQAVSTQIPSSRNNIPVILLYGIFLVIGAIFGFIVSLFIKSGKQK